MAVADHSWHDLHAQNIRRDMGLSREKMGYVMSVSAKTIENWERRDALPADEGQRHKLATIAEMVRLGLIVYGPEGFPIFLQTPLRSFGNRTPLSEIMAGHVDRVIEVLAADYEGLGY